MDYLYFPVTRPPIPIGHVLYLEAVSARIRCDGSFSHVSPSLDGLADFHGVTVTAEKRYGVSIAIDMDVADPLVVMHGRFHPDVLRGLKSNETIAAISRAWQSS